MTELNLKAVMRFDGSVGRFKPAAHNLTTQKAEEKAAALKSEGLNVQVLDQPSRHKGRSYKDCLLCKNAAENLAQQRTEDPATEEEQAEDPAVAEGGPEE